MMSVTRPSLQTPRDIASKQDRTAKILALIKDKKDLSIKDVSIAFTDCSEKTIQRELNTLVSKGHIRKVGSKRWSRYLSL
jgi:DeoR/GlpR family transcriptional regulator of sugar metabolism